MLSGWDGALATLLLVEPGWLALTCWRCGRGAGRLRFSPADCLLAIALSAAWLCLLATLAAPLPFSWPIRLQPKHWHALQPIIAFLILFAAPAALGWAAGRRARRGVKPEPVRVCLYDGTVVCGLRDPARRPAHAEVLTEAICETRGVRSRSARIEIFHKQIATVAACSKTSLVLQLDTAGAALPDDTPTRTVQ